MSKHAAAPWSIRLLRLPAVIEMVGLSASTIEREIAAGRFPKPVYPTQATKAWRTIDLDAWVDGLSTTQPAAKGE